MSTTFADAAMRQAENLSYREPAREPPRTLAYGPLAPDPLAVALTIALALLAATSFASAESSNEVECSRGYGSAEPTCVRTTRSLRDPEHERSAPALLRREGFSGDLPMDVLEYDGITLLLPNNPPGPLTAFIDDPTDHHVVVREDAALGGGFFFVLFAALAAFVLPRALHIVVRRSVTVDRAAGTVTVGGTEVAIDEIASVRVATFGDDLLSKIRGARVALRKTDGTELVLARYARPPQAHQVRFTAALAKALGTKLEIVPTPGLASSAPIVSVWLVAQLVAATLTAVLLVAWLR